MKSPYSFDEQETTINMFPANISKTAEIYTCIPNMIERMIKLHGEYPDEVAIVQGDGYITATVPRGWIKIQPKRKYNITEEQKQANINRLLSYMETKYGSKEENKDDSP